MFKQVRWIFHKKIAPNKHNTAVFILGVRIHRSIMWRIYDADNFVPEKRDKNTVTLSAAGPSLEIANQNLIKDFCTFAQVFPIHDIRGLFRAPKEKTDEKDGFFSKLFKSVEQNYIFLVQHGEDQYVCDAKLSTSGGSMFTPSNMHYITITHPYYLINIIAADIKAKNNN